MFDRYIEFCSGVYDACAECQGAPIIEAYGKKKRKKALFTIVCTSCGQLTGPAEGPGLAMAEWNKEQRKIKEKRDDS